MSIRFQGVPRKGKTTRFADYNDYRITGRQLVLWPLDSKGVQRNGKTTRFAEYNDYRITGKELVLWPLDSKGFQGKVRRQGLPSTMIIVKRGESWSCVH